MSKDIIVIGSGLCGSLMSLRLAQKGYQVRVYEKRPDMRKVAVSAGRSINLALSDRGLRGLDMVGLKEEALKLVIPMQGRMVHPKGGEAQFFSYSGRKGEYINSISRGGLNILLMDAAEATGKVKIHFETDCTDVNFESGEVTLMSIMEKTTFKDKALCILGTDGANSAVRKSMSAISPILRFNFSQKYLDTGYKELCIPPSETGDFRIASNALHIWPRQGFMMIALPNLDRSFTVTLFMPFEGSPSFEIFKDENILHDFFRKEFPDAYEHMPDLTHDFHSNPTSSLGTIKCWPWQVNGKSALMGDAAHAVVPFYGQGMNASFEDCVVLDQCMDDRGDDWESILTQYQKLRKPNADAIADLAEDNFYEMRDATADPVFNLKRKIELELEQRYPDYFSKYSMVTFREDLDYEYAMNRGRWQDKVLMDYASKISDISQVDYEQVFRMVKDY